MAGFGLMLGIQVIFFSFIIVNKIVNEIREFSEMTIVGIYNFTNKGCYNQ